MDTLSPVHDLVGDRTTTSILDVLLIGQPLTAKQIYYRLKKRRGLSLTYQAVHKRLRKLQDDRVLGKERLEYAINRTWLDGLDTFVSCARERIVSRERLLTGLQNKQPLFEGGDRKIKVISLDIRGVMATNQFDESLWRKKIPALYAKQYGMPEKDAFERVTGEYRRLLGKVSGWRDPEFWLRHFGLEVDYEDLIADIKDEIELYPDVIPTIEKLDEDHLLVIISHAHQTLLETKLGPLKKHFLKCYSASDFGKHAKDSDIYRDVCEELGVEPHEIVHLGSDPDHDYKIPASVGYHPFLIDRRGVRTEPFVVHDLDDFRQRIEQLEAGI